MAAPIKVPARYVTSLVRSALPIVRAGHGPATAGGRQKTSHIGWPPVTGILWIVRPSSRGRSDHGTELNDELLGSHRGEWISDGGAGNDHIWGHFGRGTIDCGTGWDR